MARMFQSRGGKNVVLLNPNERSRKFAFELKTNSKFTNSGQPKYRRLSKSERSFRLGYLRARKDNARAFNHNKKRNSGLFLN